MKQHTPGPWCAPSAGIYTAKGQMIANLGTAEIVKSVRKHNPQRPHGCLEEMNESIANCLLVAAAPDLFAAAQMALDAWTMPAEEFNKKYPSTSNFEAVEIALHMAIQKAKGEPA